MEHIQQTLFASASLKKPSKAKSERNELFDWFLSILNPDRRSRGFSEISYPRLGRELQSIPTKDLYALQSKMKDAMRHNFPPSVVFWKEIRVKQILAADQAQQERIRLSTSSTMKTQ